MDSSLTQAMHSLTLVRQAVATGNLPLEQEIDAREAGAQIAGMLFDATHDPSRLSEATQHYQAIIRLLKVPSLRRAKFLDKLAFLEMTVFDVSKAMKVLDDSIAHSKQARDEALPTTDPLIITIYQNLGYSVSHRAQLNNNSADLDEAIACGREVLKMSSPDSAQYQLTTNNIAARLHARYKMHHQLADAEEALSLLEGQLRRFRPGSPQHGSALLVRAHILHDRYEQTNDIQDLDFAIAGFNAGLQSLGETHERAPDILRYLSLLHDQRYKQTKDIIDLETALRHSRARLALIPTTYQIRPDHIADYLTHLVEYVFVIESLSAVQAAIKEARTLREQVSKTHPKRHSSNLSLAGMLSQQYAVSQDINHLSELVSHDLSSVYAWNEKLDITQPQVPTDGLSNFSTCVRKVALAPAGSPVRKQALQQLSQWFSAIHKSRTPLDSMVSMAHRHGQELDVFCRNLTAEESLSESQLRSGIELLQSQETTDSDKGKGRQDRVRALNRDDYIDPIFGHRHLAIDPVRKRIVFSMEGMVKNVLGYKEDDEEPKSWAEYEAREARLEHESFERDKGQGKSPNPKLCRVCRHVKLLKPADGGRAFAWNTQQYFPFGLYAQLLTRKHCAICRLVLLLNRADGGQDLHPRLAQIDREIQGTQFHAQKLTSGETMLGVEYGMTTVGALRTIDLDNLSDAVRQSSQVRALRSFLEQPGQDLPQPDQDDQSVDFPRVRGWLYDCHGNHGEPCNGLGGSERYVNDIPLVLVDVQNNCLISATSAERYFTLSYVWGKVVIATTTVAKLKERLQISSLNTLELPNTIRDAMTFVRAMGERYLWTDALCIIQDDNTIRKRDITRMDIIYKRAFANVVALSGTDANAGLPGVAAKSRPPQQIEMLPILKGSKDLAVREDSDTEAQTETVCLVATPQPLSLVQTSSVYSTRGWILQEQTLARRNIYFSSSYVYFQCGENTVCEVALEGKYSDRSEDDGKGDETEDDKEGNTSGLALKNPILELTKIRDLPEPDRLKGVFKAYSELVEIYTARDLTLPTDIFDAFAGMLSAFKEEFKSETLYGLPIAAFDLGLLWTSTTTLAVRPGKIPATSNVTPASSSSTPSATNADAGPQQMFPTWSWAGWIGGVDSRLLPLDKEPPPESLIAEIYILRNGKILRLSNYQRACQAEDSKASPELLAAYFGRMSIEARQAAPEHILHMFQPHVLNAGFSIDVDREPDYLSSAKNVHLQTGQAIVRILDGGGKHCGILFEHVDYYGALQLVSRSDELNKGLEALRTLSDKPIVAISQTKDLYGDRTALSRVEGDIKRFDPYEFPAKGPGSALVNVLVLSSGVDYFERIAVGQIHVKAWTAAGPRRAWVKIG